MLRNCDLKIYGLDRIIFLLVDFVRALSQLSVVELTRLIAENTSPDHQKIRIAVFVWLSESSKVRRNRDLKIYDLDRIIFLLVDFIRALSQLSEVGLTRGKAENTSPDHKKKECGSCLVVGILESAEKSRFENLRFR